MVQPANQSPKKLANTRYICTAASDKKFYIIDTRLTPELATATFPVRRGQSTAVTLSRRGLNSVKLCFFSSPSGLAK
jgi:hypothetical protein